jgi:hypothetical protein
MFAENTSTTNRSDFVYLRHSVSPAQNLVAMTLDTDSPRWKRSLCA